MTDINDLNVGDIITDGLRRYSVIKVDAATQEVSAVFVNGGPMQYVHKWTGAAMHAGVFSWETMGYDKEGAATVSAGQARPGGFGLLSWLPPPPSPAPAAPPNMGPLMTTAAATPPVKTRRQVSHNGKDWVDYRHLLDADDFESYTHRREV